MTNGGQMCAVGRLLENPKHYMAEYYEEENALGILGDGCQNISILKEDYRIQDIDFWLNLQSFHDTHENWNTETNTITFEGEDYYKSLVEKYSK